MENVVSFLGAIQKIVDKDPRYKIEAYIFVMSALDFTISKLKEKRHVTGQELLEGIREYGMMQFGPMTRTVFEYWGVKSTEDFGEIVFNMVDCGLMGKTEKDSKDDFKNGYSFVEAFDKGYRYEVSI